MAKIIIAATVFTPEETCTFLQKFWAGMWSKSFQKKACLVGEIKAIKDGIRIIDTNGEILRDIIRLPSVLEYLECY